MKIIQRAVLLLCGFNFLLPHLYAQTPDANNILYVNNSVTGGNGIGNSWTNAIPQLADALKWARQQNNFTSGNPLKIYVAKGTYKPFYNATDGNYTTDGGRLNAFVMVNNVQIYGGFDPDNNIDDLTDTRIFGSDGSILSGDIGTVGTTTDNTYHVVIASGSMGNALLDGFTVTGGYGDGSSDVTVSGNSLSNKWGAAIYNFSSSPGYKNIIVKNNHADWDGAGMLNNNASPVISNVLFTCNYTQYKGVVANYNNSSPVLANVTITGNTSDYYSGIFNSGSTSYIYNSIIWDNKVNGSNTAAGADIFNDGTGNATVKSSITQSYTTGNAADNNLVGTNPLFTNAAGGNYTLQNTSPAIGKGNNQLYWDAVNGGIPLPSSGGAGGGLGGLDLAGNKRLVNSTIDIGAYENQIVLTEPDGNNILYVNLNATGEGSGYNWANAIKELADALKWARAKDSFTAANPLKIYVATGTYKPLYNAANNAFTSATDRDNAFVMVTNVQIYGGFDPATGINNLADTRNYTNTILSGDIGIVGTATDNTYHVVISSGAVGSALLDGFTVRGAYSTSADWTGITVNGNSISRNYGGGMCNYSSSPAVANCNFTANTAYYGGGMYNFSSSLRLTNCNFTTNTAAIYGGGMYNIISSPTIINCNFTGNTSSSNGSGMYNGSSSSPTLTNTTIANNGSVGFYTVSGGTPVLQNCIIWDAVSGSYTAKNSLIKGASATANSNINATLYTTTDIFTNYAGGDYTLKSYSPAINKGSNQLYWDVVNGGVAPPSSGGVGGGSGLDLAGNPRVYKYADGGIIDIGAYEYQSTDIVPDANNIVYVNTAVTGSTGNGSSWANAVKELADALKWARTKNNFTTANPLKIYVAKGTYKPLYNAANDSYTTDGGGDNAFVMVNNVQLYGGFDPANNIDDLADSRLLPSPFGGDGGGSILSGDLDNSGTPNANDAYHVVISSGAVGTARLDGFTVTGAYDTSINTTGITVNSNLVYRNYGGGMSNKSSDPTVANCSFTSNWTIYGGAMYNYNSSPSLTNCNFTVNTGTISGGAMYNNISSPKVTNCSFTSNTATYGGAMFNNSSLPKVTNCNFTVNTATISGGAMYNGTYSLPTITNTTIANNGTSGFYIESGSTPVLQNSIVWDAVTGAYTAKYSLIKDKTDISNGNINAGSLAATDIFKDDAGGDYTLKSYSPAINKGSKQLYWDVVNGGVAPPSLGGVGGGDLAGNPRVYKYADDGIIDLGAYEYQTTDIVPDANNIIYVNTAVSGGLSDGSSWTNAIPQLADALKYARTKNNFTSGNPLKIYVAKGTYKPMYNAADGSYTTDGSRDNAFVMVKNVQIYGGFDPDNNIKTLDDARILPPSGGFGSILSGDLDNSGTRNANDAYHVVISSGVAVETAKLDGFTVTGGYSASSDNYAIVVNGVAIIRRNGGGMYNTTFFSPPAVTNCNFMGNSAGANGGGIYNTASSSSPLVITNCSFAANTANIGGGMCNSSSSSVIVNCSFTANTANNVGGGMYNNSSSPAIINTTIANNGSNGFYNSSSTPVLQNSIVWDAVSGTYTASYSLIKGANPSGTGNINATGLAATDIFTDYAGGDYTLKSYSPAINKGDNALFTGLDANTKDILGNPRVYKYADGRIIDMGAYEYQSTDIVPDANNIIYVNTAVSGGLGNGNSWVNAAKELADALKWARQKNNFTVANPLKIYVAKGTYKPMYNAADASYTTDGGRDNAFVMVNNVQLYGGFDPDNGIDDLTDTRNYISTTLSGDIGTVGLNADNTYHVVVSSGEVGNAKLDGFTVTGAYAASVNSTTITVNGNSLVRYYGGGMSNYSSSPVVSNCSFIANVSYLGGGVSNHNASPTLTNISIIGNTTSGGGAGISNRSSSSPTLTNVSIRGNTATSRGGGVWNDTSSPTFTNVSISGNKTINGDAGGVCNYYSSATLINVTISGNTAPLGAGGIYNVSSSNTKIYNSIIWGNNTGIGNYNSTPEISYSIVQGGYTGTGNLNANPLFVSSPAHTTAPFTGGDYTLKNGSPAIAKGDNTLFTGLTAATLDLAGNPRVYNYATGGTIDLGAYEYQDLTSQTITFAALDPKTTASTDFALTATASSTLAVTYTSSNTAVAEVYQDGSVWKVKIKGEGNTNITASQVGDGNYSAATSVVQQLTVIGVPLPVTLINYTAKAEGNYAKLQWQTSVETNNKGFEIYRAVESEKQKAESKENTTFVKIGEVSAPVTHNTQPVTQYNFTDKTPLNGNNYYKLVQVDNNGKATELGVRTVAFNFPLSTFNLYPNPTTNKITVTFNQGKYHLLTLSDNLGKVLQQQSIGVQSVDVVVDLTTYPIGIYFITLQSANESITKKVIKR